MPSQLLEDVQVRHALTPVISAAPHGADSLETLGDEFLSKLLVHPDAVRVVYPTRFLVDLPMVDPKGYEVYDHTFTRLHGITQDADLSVYPKVTEDALVGFMALKVSDAAQFFPGNEIQVGDGFIAIQEVDKADHRIYLAAPLTVDLPKDSPLLPRFRKMRFGASFLDTLTMRSKQHGDHFFISYKTVGEQPRVVLVVVLDPTVTTETQAYDARYEAQEDTPPLFTQIMLGSPFSPATSYATFQRLVEGEGA